MWEDVKLPDGKVLIPGVVTPLHASWSSTRSWWPSASSASPASSAARTSIAGADCGFASFAVIDEIHPSVVWAKLEALAEGARIASERLW